MPTAIKRPLPVYIARLLESALDSYQTREERAALRRGLGDAAVILDHCASSITISRQGRISKEKRQALEALKEAADVIWDVRERVPVPGSGEQRS